MALKKNVILKSTIFDRFSSQRAFSKLAGVREGIVSEIVQGKRNPTDLEARRICDALGMEIHELF